MAVDVKIFAELISPGCTHQIYSLAAEPAFCNSKIRIMPDAHKGIGAVIGFTATMTDKIIPNVIGVDIGCGMLTVMLGKRDIDYKALDSFIKANIPSGKNYRKTGDCFELIDSLYARAKLSDMPRVYGSVGSLGGGNHFIEIDEDDEGEKYLVIHSGSRNLGKQIATIYQKAAILSCKSAPNEERERLIAQLKSEHRQGDIPDALKKLTEKYADQTKTCNEYCYLMNGEKEAYMHDMRICQEVALRNRRKMADDILNFLEIFKSTDFETVHNYIDDKGIIRKGAVSAEKGKKLLIPMNMRDGAVICEGLGNEDWNCSAPHGAGRLICRSDAKEMITLSEFTDSMKGVFTTTATMETLDEAPMAYKPMESILSAISPTVKIVKQIKPKYNFKAAD